MNSKQEQWTYVTFEENPADIETRSILANELESSTWLRGPDFRVGSENPIPDTYPLLNPDDDNKLRKVVSVIRTDIQSTLG